MRLQEKQTIEVTAFGLKGNFTVEAKLPDNMWVIRKVSSEYEEHVGFVQNIVKPELTYTFKRSRKDRNG